MRALIDGALQRWCGARAVLCPCSHAGGLARRLVEGGEAVVDRSGEVRVLQQIALEQVVELALSVKLLLDAGRIPDHCHHLTVRGLDRVGRQLLCAVAWEGWRGRVEGVRWEG